MACGNWLYLFGWHKAQETKLARCSLTEKLQLNKVKKFQEQKSIILQRNEHKKDHIKDEKSPNASQISKTIRSYATGYRVINAETMEALLTSNASYG